MAFFTPRFHLESIPKYRTSDLYQPETLSSLRQDIEKIAEQLDANDIGASHYFGLMDMQPSLQRVFFIHVPKCGGTSVRKLLVHNSKFAPVPVPGSGAIDQSIDFMIQACPPDSPQQHLLQQYSSENTTMDRHQRFLRVYVGHLLTQQPEKAFVLGHKRALGFLPLYRADTDTFITTVRAPANILKSMASYRVHHTLKYEKRPESIALLKDLRMDITEFTKMVESQPRAIAQKILEKDAPSMAEYLSFQKRSDHKKVIDGLKQHRVFVAHMSEQNQMLSALFGEQTEIPRENTSELRRGLAAEFNAAVQTEWAEPFVDPVSSQVYQTLESSGIIGYWEDGGTRTGYLKLLKHL